MGKPSGIDKAITNLVAERDVLNMAIQRLIAQRDAKPAKPARAAKPAPVEKSA